MSNNDFFMTLGQDNHTANENNHLKSLEPIDDTCITPEELEKVIDILAENSKKEPLKVLRDIIDSPIDNNEELIEEDIADVALNPLNGEMSIADIHEDDIIDLSSDFNDIKQDLVEEKFETLKTNDRFKDMQLTDDEAAALLKLIYDYNKDRNIDSFERLPGRLKMELAKQSAENGLFSKKELNAMANVMLDLFLDELKIDSIFVDLEKSVEETFKIPSFLDLINSELRTDIEKDINEKIAILEENGETEKADKLKNVYKAYNDAYTLCRIIDKIKTPGKYRNQIVKHTRDYKDLCYDFNDKFDKSIFKLVDINTLYPVLKRKFIGENDDPVLDKKIIMLINTFIDTCIDLDSNDLEDAAYIHFTTKNLHILGYTGEELTDFSQQLINTITSIFNEFDILIAEREERIKNVSKKRNKKIK